MDVVKNRVMELVNEVEAGVNEYENVNRIIDLLSKALETGKVDKQFVMQIDERLGLEYFS